MGPPAGQKGVIALSSEPETTYTGQWVKDVRLMAERVARLHHYFVTTLGER
jgi:hypothetical protein